MAKPNYQFEKRQKEIAKKNKKEEKRRQKVAGNTADADGTQDAANLSETVPPDTHSTDAVSV